LPDEPLGRIEDFFPSQLHRLRDIHSECTESFTMRAFELKRYSCHDEIRTAKVPPRYLVGPIESRIIQICKAVWKPGTKGIAANALHAIARLLG
jgi:hypothetical protein